ncbi:MAG: hypothetical protein WA790_14050 [Sulfitobacter sp.]
MEQAELFADLLDFFAGKTAHLHVHNVGCVKKTPARRELKESPNTNQRNINAATPPHANPLSKRALVWSNSPISLILHQKQAQILDN